MVYNRSSPYACGLTRCDEMPANGRYIRMLPPYPRLHERPAPNAVAFHLESRRSLLAEAASFIGRGNCRVQGNC
jgi:hypothetical protein